MVYRFIDKYKDYFGLRWLYRKFKFSTRSYYNYCKHKKSEYYAQRRAIYERIKYIYYNSNCTFGYRVMQVVLSRYGIHLSKLTVHKYMNNHLNLKAVIMRKKPNYIAGKKHKIFDNIIKSVYDDKVVNPLVTGKTGVAAIINKVLAQFPNESPVNNKWIISPYAPTPTIIEAARALYENHTVEDITRHEADKVSTDRTIAYILSVIQKSKANQQKSICFVTGVPGTGKTLVDLDVAVKQTYQGGDEPIEDEQAVYLSGNGPLVAVLNEALAQDNFKKCRVNGENKKITDSRREVNKSIQIIHRYRDNMLAKIKNPVANGVF